MTPPLRLWIAARHHPAFRCGGWSYVRRQGEDIGGKAGGERNITAQRIALAALRAALIDAPGATPIELLTDSDVLLSLAPVLRNPAAAPADAHPADDLDLWAPVLAALAGRSVSVRKASPAAAAAFVTSWAELARDKAKAAGAFSAAIPKANILKTWLAPGV